jgi:catechol 2,3-dioxygenase-like lactoylglutathione lyase family enzyme
MIDHTGVKVSDLARSRNFYRTALGNNVEAVCREASAARAASR